jgi:hypothetical protein
VKDSSRTDWSRIGSEEKDSRGFPVKDSSSTICSEENDSREAFAER